MRANKGADGNGAERRGTEWSGEDWRGKERMGMDGNGLERNGAERTGGERSGVEGKGSDWIGRVFLPTYGCVPIHHFGKSGVRRMKSLSHLPLWRAEEELDRLEREKCDET